MPHSSATPFLLPPELRRPTQEILAKRVLNFEMSAAAINWGWALMDAGAQSDALYGLTALSAPAHWAEVNRWVDQIAADLDLPLPQDEQAATRWLAQGHLADICAAQGDDFSALKKVSRLWFDSKTPDLELFYRLKHAIREVETSGQQGHVPGLTRDNWRKALCAAATEWLACHPLPSSVAIVG